MFDPLASCILSVIKVPHADLQNTLYW